MPYLLVDHSNSACSLDLDQPPTWLVAGGAPVPSGLPPAFVTVAAHSTARLAVALAPAPASISIGTAVALPEFVPVVSLEAVAPDARAPRPPSATRSGTVQSAGVARHPVHTPRRRPPGRPARARRPSPQPRPVPMGFDISWPQCGGAYPGRPTAIAVVGINDGSAFSLNPCLASEARWGSPRLQLYINVNSPTALNRSDVIGPAGHCSRRALACLAYNFGYNSAGVSLALAANRHIPGRTWWLDIEEGGTCSTAFPTNNVGYWSCNPGLNTLTIQGAINQLRSHHLVVGVYTTGPQWQTVTGGYTPRGDPLQTWIAGADAASRVAVCQSRPVAGVRPRLVQVWPPAPYDIDLSC